jgi:hypothetical protein
MLSCLDVLFLVVTTPRTSYTLDMDTLKLTEPIEDDVSLISRKRDYVLIIMGHWCWGSQALSVGRKKE